MSGIRIEFLGAHLWLVILVCLAFLAASYVYYRRTTPPLPESMRWLLIGLRSLAFVALFLALAQPIITYSTVSQLKKRMAVLVDRSASMTLPLAPGGDKSRLETAQEILDGGDLSSLRSNLDVTGFAFAESLVVADNAASLPGKTTNPGLALAQLRRQSALDPYDYILLVSDGRTTEGENPADVAGVFGRPILTVAVGDSVRTEDIALDDVFYNEVVFAGRQTEIKGVVSQQGEIDGKLQIRLTEGGRALAQKTDDPPGGGKTAEYSLAFTPQAPGRLFLNLDVNAPGNETNAKNNRRTFAVRVLKSKLKVLIYASSLNQEYAFLNRFLKSRQDYDVTTVIDAPGGERYGERFPDTQEKLNSYDLIIMIDPNFRRISSHFETIVSYMTDRGGGILLLMGEEYAASAAGNRLESISPLAVASGRRQPVRYGKFHLVPDPQMTFHPAVKLAENREEIVSLWANQPPFTISLMTDSVRAGAAVLGYIDNEAGPSQEAGAAFRRYGAGKILAFAVAPFWHWAFYPVSVGGDPSLYQEFFTATIRWLTISDESDRISFKPVKEVFQSGEEALFSGYIRDQGFRPIDNAGGDLTIVSDSGDSVRAAVVPDPSRPGGYRAAGGILSPGRYRYHVDLAADSIRLGRFDGEFAVDDIDRETAFGNVDWTSLAQTAQNSGGVFVSYKNLRPLVDGVSVDRIRVEQTHDIRLWDHLILLIIIIVTLSLEWFLRKRRQLL